MRRAILICLLIAGCGLQPDTREELEYLNHAFNLRHASDTMINEEYDPEKHFFCSHDKGYFHHRNCRTCDENCRILCRKHELLHRHPEWKPKPPPRPEPEDMTTPPAPGKPITEPKSIV